MHKLSAALVVTIVLALLASALAVLEVRRHADDLKLLLKKDVAALNAMHEVAIDVESAARAARMSLLTGDRKFITQRRDARAAAERRLAELARTAHGEKQKRIISSTIARVGEAAHEMDRALAGARAGDANAAFAQVLHRVEPLREKVRVQLTELANEKKAELARRTADYTRVSDRTLLFVSMFGGTALLCGGFLALLLRQSMRKESASEARLRHIFQGAAVAIIEEDYAPVAAVLDQLKVSGVQDLREHLEKNPALLPELANLVGIRHMNPAMVALIELPDALPRHSLESIFLPQTLPIFREVLVALWNGEPGYQGETIFQTYTGRPVEALLTMSFPDDVRRQPVVTTLTDLTSSKHQERVSREALEHNEARLRAVFDQCPIAITMTDVAGRLVYMNPAGQQIMGAAGDSLGRQSLELIAPEERARIAQWRQDFLSGGSDQSDLTIAIPAKGGGQRTLRVQANLLHQGEEVRGIVSTIEDITERLRLEEQVHQVQKMEAVGQLAGGVAHDFNNLLTVILNGASLLQTGATKDQRELLEQVEAAAERAATLTAQLLAFGRKQVVRSRIIDLNDLVANHCRMLQRLVGEKIQLEAQLEPSGAPSEVDPNLIELLLMNLVVNARDAMPLGGRIEISLASVAPEGERTGRMIRLSVRDTGTGIASEHLPHVFEPFFTTKAVGKGTGLGLATVYGIVEQHRGRIDVETGRGEGTTFHVYLPRAESSMAAWTEPAHVAPDGAETILLVEDEEAVRQMVATSLGRCGYRVLEAPDGDAALSIWQTRAAQVDLLLTDMVMPGTLSGRELAIKLRHDRPQLKVVYMSGYGAHDLAGEPWSILVQKPFQLSTLAQVLRARLDESEPSMPPKPLLANAG